MIDLKDWIEHIRSHKLLFKFKGLGKHGDRGSFFASVGEAATHDERFMDAYMDGEYTHHEKHFNDAVEAKYDEDEVISSFCEYVEGRASAASWKNNEMPLVHDWSEASMDQMLRVVSHYSEAYKEDFIRDHLIGDIQIYWDMLRSPDHREWLLKDHPPEEALCHAGGYGIPVEDVFFVCPACHGEPQTEKDLADAHEMQNGYPRFYCGSCGSEMTVDKHENILDFFNSLDVTPYPFNPEKQAHWKKLMADRKAWGNNKLELAEGDWIYLKKTEPMTDLDTGRTWMHVTDEPGELVRVTKVDFPTVSYEIGSGDFGGIAYDHVYGRKTHES